MVTTANDLKKGDRVYMTPVSNPRTGVLMDNKKGMIRMVHIDEKNGYFPDMGSVYIDEIFAYLNKETGKIQTVELSDSHSEELKIRDQVFK